MKPLLPTLKEKKRYLTYQVVTDKNIKQKDVIDAINSSLHQLIGDLGVAKTGLVHLNDWENNKGILRVSAKKVDETRCAMAMIRNVNKVDAYIKVINVSGSLKKSRLKIKMED